MSTNISLFRLYRLVVFVHIFLYVDLFLFYYTLFVYLSILFLGFDNFVFCFGTPGVLFFVIWISLSLVSVVGCLLCCLSPAATCDVGAEEVCIITRGIGNSSGALT